MTSIVERVARWAIEKHKGQLYGKWSYSVHLHAVADSVYKMCKDYDYDRYSRETLMMVAYCHDLLEDTDTTVEEIIDMCGITVAYAVSAMTKVKGESYEQYINKIRSNSWSLEVKKHDTLCNLTQSVMDGNSKRIIKYSKQLQLLTEV